MSIRMLQNIPQYFPAIFLSFKATSVEIQQTTEPEMSVSRSQPVAGSEADIGGAGGVMFLVMD